MWSLKVLIALCTVIQWEANGVHGWWYPSDCYNLRFQNAPSGMYYIQPLGPNTQPIRVYCEMTIGGVASPFSSSQPYKNIISEQDCQSFISRQVQCPA